MLDEAAQTVGEVIMIDRGRLVHEGAIRDLERSGERVVVVRTAEAERLSGLVVAACGRTQREVGGGLLVEGLDAGEVARLAHSSGVLLEEIVQRNASLEDAFFGLTGGADR